MDSPFDVVPRSVLLAAWLVLAVPAAGAASPDDPQVFALIDSLVPVAGSIVVDGDCSDWGAIPIFADPVGDAGGDASRDISGVAIAPLDDALLVRIEWPARLLRARRISGWSSTTASSSSGI